MLADSATVDAAGAGSLRLASAAPGAPPFALSLRAYATGAVRVRILEAGDLPPRWEVRGASTPARTRVRLQFGGGALT